MDYNDRTISTNTNLIDDNHLINRPTSHTLTGTLIGEERYNFKFSTLEDVEGKPSRCRILTVILLVIATLFLPVAIFYDRLNNKVDWNFPWNSWLVYVIIVDTTILMIGGAYIVSSVAYPYSNSLLVRSLSVRNNRSFGLEFAR
jgi:hypothetical protein